MIAGGCRCGAVRYELALDTLPPVYCCHCRDCQTWSGSAFVEQAVLREEALRITAGPPAEYAFISASGVTSRQFACSACWSRLYTLNPTRRGLVTLRAGTLDESDTLRPALHIWTRRMQPWIAIPDAVPGFAENAPAADFAAVLRAAGMKS